jgi:GT2 family glycosyltransferase/glycosyltransferase involved in cell wall biosynthesis
MSKTSKKQKSDISEPSNERVINGNIEGFDGRVISGWASDNGPSSLLLKIFLDGELYSEIPADLPRPDVIEAGLSTANAGFTVEIPSMFLADGHCTVRVVETETETEIYGSPFLIDIPPPAPTSDSTDLSAMVGIVEGVTERTTNVARLQTNIALIMGWLQHSVDRANALKQADALAYERLNQAVASVGGLSGSVGHFYGILQQSYPQIKLERHEKPRVSIVIPVHNKFELTYNCINSISNSITEVSYEVIVVDDSSSDETLLSPLVFLGGCQIARTPNNVGFVGACNTGAARARGEYLIFLNNDTIVSDGWLDALSDTLDRDPAIGIVGSRLLFADGVLQEAGGIIWRDGSGWNWGRGQDRMHPTYSFMRDADYVSGAALMIRHDLFREMKGFDELYAPAYYEDTDLCFRVRAKGYRVVMQPCSTIIHLEGQSNGTSTTSGLKRYQVVNAKKFRNRWAKVLEKHRPNAQDPIHEAERGVERRALFIDETTPTPDQDAGSNAALQHMQSLQRLGYKVVFLPADNMAFIPKYTEALQALGIECWYAPFAWSVEEYFRRNERNFDVVYIHRRNNLQRYLHLVEKYAKTAKIVYNYADIHALRDLREAEIAKAPRDKIAELEDELEAELDIANQVDAVIVHSTYEADLIRDQRPSANVHYVPWTVETIRGPATFGRRSGVVFVGGYGHPPNTDAVDWMISDIWPLISSEQTEHAFRIVGSRMPDRFKDLRAPSIDPVGFVGDLDEFLDGTAVTVAPLRYGAGLKGKVLTSLARGVPCVMSPVAAEGLDLPEELEHLVRESPEEFSEEVLSLLNDKEKWQQTSEMCVSFVRERFSQEVIDRLITETLRGRRRGSV